MNTHSVTWIFASNNGIIPVMFLIFTLEINFGKKILQFKENFDYTGFPNKQDRNE